MSVDQMPEQGEGQRQFSDQSSIDPPRESPESLRAKITSLIPVRRFISRFVNDPRGRKFALGGIGLAYLLSQLPAGGGETQASQDPTPTPTPGPKATATGEMPSLGASSVEKAETSPANPYIFVDDQDRKREWRIDNARFGTPPNEPDRPVGAIDDSINGTYARTFQPYTLKYPEIKQGKGIFVGFAGVAVDVLTKRAYTITIVDDSSGNIFHLRLEIIANFNNPTDYSDEARGVYIEGLHQGGTYGDPLRYMKMGADEKGKYVEVGIKNSLITTEDGPRRQYLDSNGYPAGGFIRIAEPTPTPTATPSPEPTVSPTVPPTPTVTPTPGTNTNSASQHKVFLPGVARDSLR